MPRRKLESVSVSDVSSSHVIKKGPVLIRMHLRMTDYPPMLRPTRTSRYGHRYFEIEAQSPTIADLDKLIRWVNSKYNRGTTHTFFENVDIYERNGKTVLELGIGS